jgi:hypothetical protein
VGDHHRRDVVRPGLVDQLPAGVARCRLAGGRVEPPPVGAASRPQ